MNVYVFTVDDKSNCVPYVIVIAENKEVATEIAAELAKDYGDVRLFESADADKTTVIVTKPTSVTDIYTDYL